MKIALDIDDVLAGFVIEVHKVFNTKLVPHDHWDPNESTGQLILDLNGPNVYNQTYLDMCEHNEDFWMRLEPISLPVDIQFDVACYITSSPENMVPVRRRWLEVNGFPKAPVIHSKNKHLTMQRLGIDFLIDDKASVVSSINKSKSGERAMVFYPWYTTIPDYENRRISLNEITF